MRGTDRAAVGADDRRRFIPAHAGNSRTAHHRCRGLAVHPRACGEQAAGMRVRSMRPGSSPRMRGTDGQAPDGHVVGRFIPAHAGNRTTRRTSTPSTAVHPRACGEQLSPGRSCSGGSGSSPRMRGTGRAGPHQCGQCRFIPAHAGNRTTACFRTTRGPVHPRACGEQQDRHHGRGRVAGSSPRMRGTVFDVKGAALYQRFIPAHAGNRAISRAVIWLRPVHPRACGEQSYANCEKSQAAGSSPRMRGTGFERTAALSRKRFIPAHAGNRARRRRARPMPPVHPRACGEQSGPTGIAMRRAGSSPRMRGTVAARSCLRRFRRFIPAHAGNR